MTKTKETECSELTENFYLLQPAIFEVQVYAGSFTESFLRDQYKLLCVVNIKPSTSAFLNNKSYRLQSLNPAGVLRNINELSPYIVTL